jgi:hypothetical protein
MSDEQQGQATATTTEHESPKSACPHPEAVGTRWGDPVREERQGELLAILDAWNAPGADHGARRGPFDPEGMNDVEGARRRLSGADVGWLADQSGRDEFDQVPNLHLERANFDLAHLEGADLRAAHVEGALLDGAHLERADLFRAHLEGAILDAAHLEGASLQEARLEGAFLVAAYLEGVDLSLAHLEGPTFSRRTWRGPTSAGHNWRGPTSAGHNWRGPI